MVVGWVKPILLAALCLIAPVEKVCSVLNLIAIERDWIVTIADHTPLALETLNSRMRRIDLICKLFGPLMIALIDGVSTKLAISLIFGTNAVCIIVEYFTIVLVYRRVPALSQRKTTPQASNTSTVENSLSNPAVIRYIKQAATDLRAYIKHEAFQPSLALCFLYFTVLSFAGQMVAFLVSVDYTSTHIGLMRTAAVIVELSATWVTPLVIARIGPVRTGLWSINYQLCCLVPSVGLFWAVKDAHIAVSALILGVILSRVGLWGFDLSAQIIVQEVGCSAILNSIMTHLTRVRLSKQKPEVPSPPWKLRSRTFASSVLSSPPSYSLVRTSSGIRC